MAPAPARGINELDRLAREERWTEEALEKAVGVKPEPPPVDETAVKRFVRTTAQQAEAEARKGERRTRLEHEHPNLTVDDEFRSFALAQRAARRHRRRGRIP